MKVLYQMHLFDFNNPPIEVQFAVAASKIEIAMLYKATNHRKEELFKSEGINQAFFTLLYQN